MNIEKVLGEKFKPDMTAEQIIAALKDIDVISKSEVSTNYVEKKNFDAAMADASNWKKKYKETLGDAERKAAEQEELFENMKSELSAYKRSDALSKAENAFLALGYSDELAKASAKAQVDGDNDALFKNMKKHEEDLKKSFIDANQKRTPKPPAGNTTPPQTTEVTPKDPFEFCKAQILNAQQED